jgi:hypothetical protein
MQVAVSAGLHTTFPAALCRVDVLDLDMGIDMVPLFAENVIVRL